NGSCALHRWLCFVHFGYFGCANNTFRRLSLVLFAVLRSFGSLYNVSGAGAFVDF
ncbi:5880_t:CDS:2, partial [Gigaspora rosea]